MKNLNNWLMIKLEHQGAKKRVIKNQTHHSPVFHNDLKRKRRLRKYSGQTFCSTKHHKQVQQPWLAIACNALLMNTSLLLKHGLQEVAQQYQAKNNTRWK